jgi:hypothetical protein
LRDELLNEEVFASLADLRRKLARWRYDYNIRRPHSAMKGQAPASARRARDIARRLDGHVLSDHGYDDVTVCTETPLSSLAFEIVHAAIDAGYG